MSEIISLHIGQTGINLGLRSWSLIETEFFHLENAKAINEGDYYPIYHVKDKKLMEPRAIFVDTDNSVLDTMRFSNLEFPLNPAKIVMSAHDTEGVPFAQGPEAKALQTELMETLVVYIWRSWPVGWGKNFIFFLF